MLTCMHDATCVVQIFETEKYLLRDVLDNAEVDLVVIVLSDIFYAKSQDLCDETSVRTLRPCEVKGLVVREVVAKSGVHLVCACDFREHCLLIRSLRYTFFQKGLCSPAGQNFERDKTVFTMYALSDPIRQRVKSIEYTRPRSLASHTLEYFPHPSFLSTT